MSRSEKYLLVGLGLLFTAFFLSLNYPLLSIFNVAETWQGIPKLFLYIFGIWSLVILISFVLINWQEGEE